MNSHIFHRIGHYSLQTMLAGDVLLLGLAVADVFLDVPDRITGIALAAWTLTLVVVAGSMFVHGRRLCEPCIARMPLDGQEKAARWERHLATFHFLIDQPWRLVVAAAVWIGAGYVLDPLIGGPGANVVLYSLVIWWVWSTLRHEKVEPWCKRCGWGEDGDEEWVPESTPDPSASR
jgi:hypothetical protein